MSNIYNELSKQIENQLRVDSYPLAVKLIKSINEIPEGSVRPRKDLGYSLSTCQAFSYSRRRGRSIAELRENMW